MINNMSTSINPLTVFLKKTWVSEIYKKHRYIYLNIFMMKVVDSLTSIVDPLMRTYYVASYPGRLHHEK